MPPTTREKNKSTRPAVQAGVVPKPRRSSEIVQAEREAQAQLEAAQAKIRELAMLRLAAKENELEADNTSEKGLDDDDGLPEAENIVPESIVPIARRSQRLGAIRSTKDDVATVQHKESKYLYR